MEENKFTFRWLEYEDYDNILKGWWESWGWPPLPKDFLPDDGRGGIMVYKGDQNICAGFFYLSNSKTGFLEFIISNKEYKEKDRAEAIICLIDTLSQIMKEEGCKYIYTFVRNESLKQKYLKCGFSIGGKQSTEMIKTI